MNAKHLVQIEIPIPLNEKVWVVDSGQRQETITCPECLGSKRVKVSLPNGETFQLKCAACGHGYEKARGYVDIYTYDARPVEKIFQTVRLDDDPRIYMEGKNQRSGRLWYEGDIYLTRKEAEARCVELNQELEEKEKQRLFCKYRQDRTKYAWSVHYWRGQKKDAERRLNYAIDMLFRAKEAK